VRSVVPICSGDKIYIQNHHLSTIRCLWLVRAAANSPLATTNLFGAERKFYRLNFIWVPQTIASVWYTIPLGAEHKISEYYQQRYSREGEATSRLVPRNDKAVHYCSTWWCCTRKEANSDSRVPFYERALREVNQELNPSGNPPELNVK